MFVCEDGNQNGHGKSLCNDVNLHKLDTLAKLDSNLAPRAYDGAQQSVSWRPLRVVLHSDIQVLQFIVSELLDDLAE